MKIYAINIKDRIPEYLAVKLFPCMALDKQERYKRFLKIEDSERLLAADVLVRFVLCGSLNLKNHELSFGKNDNEKPFLENYDDSHFNVSHSGQWVVAAFDHDEIGIDIQDIKPVEMDLAKRFFSKKEYKDLLKKDESLRQEYFHDLWTLKESFIKAIGRGLSVGLDTFSFEITDTAGENEVGGEIRFESDKQYKKYIFKQYDIEPGYKMAVCAVRGPFPEKITMIDLAGIDESGVLYKK